LRRRSRPAPRTAAAPCARAAEKRQRAEENVRHAQRELEAAIVDAHRAGESYSAIGRVLGISRQRVAQIVERAK
jgi:DNA-directed RNA polymerase specialized sigma24 family protein